MDGVEADQKFRFVEDCPDLPDVLDGVMILDGVHLALALGFADILHVYEYAVDSVFFGDLRHVGPVGDIH